MSDMPLVFISCGQVTESEISLGRDICALVKATPGMDAFFAHEVTSVEALSTEIFRNLKRASAFIAVMHHRGVVTGRQGDPMKTRASVWIEQEVAIAAFLAFTEGRKIEVAAYVQRGISLEGVREKLAFNPVAFEAEAQVLADLRDRLPRWRLQLPQSNEPSVALEISHKREVGTSELHMYELVVKMTNTSKRAISKYAAELEFPEAFIGSQNIYGMQPKKPGSAHRVVLVYRDPSNEPILPGRDCNIFGLQYRVTTSQYNEREQLFSLPVNVSVWVEGQLAGQISVPFDKLQNF